jgi:hypothetical protein
MPLSHFGFAVPKDKYEAIVEWYLAALAPIKYEKVMDFGNVVGIGANKVPDFWISTTDDAPEKHRFHLAFHADGQFPSSVEHSHVHG